MTTHTLQSFLDLVDLASDKIGGAALWCSDDFFASKDNLVKLAEPVWDEHKYTDQGKWMDGWESRRSHDNEDPNRNDVCLVRLGAPGVIRGVVVDTAFFRGNYGAYCAIEGTSVEGYPPPQDIMTHASWVTVLEKQPLQGNFKNTFEVKCNKRFTHIRLRMYPDGGIARLRVYGEPLADVREHGGLDATLDLAAAELGGIVESCSDMFFGSRHNLLFASTSTGMHDGWETRRSRRVGHDWAIVRLGIGGTPARIVVDTSHFKGNSPRACWLEAAKVNGTPDNHTVWSPVMARTPLLPHTRHVLFQGIAPIDATHVRFCIEPDGGVARLRVFGTASDDGKAAHQLRRINAMLPKEADQAFLSCCGSRAWAAAMAGARPFASMAAVHAEAEQVFARLTDEDWHEAFLAHPRIGQKVPEGHATAHSQVQSSHEQNSVAQASTDVQTRLRQRNDEYFQRFGFIYIIKATGKSAEEMLSILEQRLNNTKEQELNNAAVEQQKITTLRLQRLC